MYEDLLLNYLLMNFITMSFLLMTPLNLSGYFPSKPSLMLYPHFFIVNVMLKITLIIKKAL